MKKIAMLLVLGIIIISSTQLSSAQDLEYYGVESTINEDLTVHTKVVINFIEPVGSLDYELDFPISNLVYNANFDFAECESKGNNEGTTISCTFIGMTEEQNKITMEFDSNSLVRPAENDYRITADFGISSKIQNYFILFKLPPNSILAGEEGKSYFPLTGGTLTDGKRIMVFWEDDTLVSGENLQFSVLFTKPGLSSDMFGIMVTAIIILIAIAALAGSFYVFRSRKAKVAVVKSVMNKDEKKIIDILNAKGGKSGQKVIVRETDFSKAKVSRIVKNLKDRGVVDTEPISGRENRVILVFGKKPLKENQ